MLAHDAGEEQRNSMGFYFASADATRIVFAGGGHWVAGDTDDMFTDDVYTAEDGVVERVSQGTKGGNADSFSAEPTAMCSSPASGSPAMTRTGTTARRSPTTTTAEALVFVSADGARIVFETTERLVPADTDETIDVYQRAGGVTALLSPARPDREPIYGERDSDVFFVDASLDGSIAYLESEEQLTPTTPTSGMTASACTRRPQPSRSRRRGRPRGSVSPSARARCGSRAGRRGSRGAGAGSRCG